MTLNLIDLASFEGPQKTESGDCYLHGDCSKQMIEGKKQFQKKANSSFWP